MTTLKWVIEVLFKLLKAPFQDSFRTLLKHNIGQGVEVKLTGEWKKGVIIKMGSDYAVFMIEKKEVFIPLPAIQGIKMTEL